MFDRILVGYNGSEGAKKALLIALTLARKWDAYVCALSVDGQLPQYTAGLIPKSQVDQQRLRYFRRIVEEAKAAARGQGVDLDTAVVPRNPARVIVNYAHKGNFDLIILGHKAQSRLHEFVIRATTDRVADAAPCCVLIVPQKRKAAS